MEAKQLTKQQEESLLWNDSPDNYEYDWQYRNNQ